MKLKTFLLCLLMFLVGAGAGILVSGVLGASAEETGAPKVTEPVLTVNTEKNVSDVQESENLGFLRFADSVLKTLRGKDYEALSAFVHPEKGLLFVPYSTVNTTANLRFTSDEIAALKGDDKKRVWGIYDGSGEPIELTVAEYFDKFVYNADYLNAPQVGINSILYSGNSLENVTEAFPEASFVEYHFKGFDPQYEGLDWCSLKVVAEKLNGEWKLIALIHSQWTI